MNIPPIGLTYESTVSVSDALIVPALPNAFPAMADMPPVFATAFMVAFVEATCIEALTPYLESGEGTVGTKIDMSHVAPTPTGSAVTAKVELIAVENRKLQFRVRCSDEADHIGEGLHERALIDRHRFGSKLKAKKGLTAPQP